MKARLTDSLLGLLAKGERWTAQTLADELGVSLRSVRRGLALMQQEGVTLDSEPGRGGGVRLARRSGVPRMALTQREVITLLMGLAVAESYGAPLLATELRTLRGKLGLVLGPADRAGHKQLRERVLLGGAASEAVRSSWQMPRPAMLAQLQEAFFAQQGLGISYCDGMGQSSRRDIEPQYLLINAPVWYVLAWDLGKQATRCFRLDRISQAQPRPGRFLLRPAAQMMDEVGQFFSTL
ncbi:helix-turn-helix transcriptional regulator [Roseateles oligotrophus]|uniref:WYL domain-containing protein n=1 Tax=Roseateles oligotrophus TaxID=1769250 RepID=A0ABT2Y8B7_9BURK|nr:WYL domain-containing protein [Roseateles oligotrophus]MCV2366539.1 WYL domain-containing protein [Roseateles oligotrophus]